MNTTEKRTLTLKQAQCIADRLERERQALLNTYGLTDAQIIAKRERLRDLTRLLEQAWADVRRLKHESKRLGRTLR